MPDSYPAVELRRQRVLFAQTMTTRCLDRLALTNGFQVQICTRNSKFCTFRSWRLDQERQSLASQWPGTVVRANFKVGVARAAVLSCNHLPIVVVDRKRKAPEGRSNVNE